MEQAVERSGPERTRARPGEFAVNSLYPRAPSVGAERRVVDVELDTPGTPVHEADIADRAGAALMDDRHTGRAYDLAGPRR
ncbi:hypothetical protein ACIRRX_19130 [Streptomyces bacillaris]